MDAAQSALSSGYASAHAQAVAHAGAPRQWRPRSTRRFRKVLIACGACVLGASFALGFRSFHQSVLINRPDTTEATSIAQMRWGASTGVPVSRPSPPRAGAESLGIAIQVPPLQPGQVSILRNGADVIINLENAPLVQAVDGLRSLTRANLHGAELLSGSPTVTLHWRGQGALQAWTTLLSAAGNAAVSCSEGNCEVFFLGTDHTVATSSSIRQPLPQIRYAPMPAPVAASGVLSPNQIPTDPVLEPGVPHPLEADSAG